MDAEKIIAVTGATGFIGKHTVHFLNQTGKHRIIAVGRNEEKLQSLGTEYVIHDMEGTATGCYEKFGRPDALIHLAWDDLTDYQDMAHIEKSLPASYHFIKNLVMDGLDNITVAGTCLEYGIQNGCLSEDQPALPSTPYGIAKDSLRKFLMALQGKQSFRLKWARLFYMYGSGQKPNSLFAELERAIDMNDKEFDMSDGQQIRDYLPVEEVAQRLSFLSLCPQTEGIVNICSGIPISVRSMVERHLAERKVAFKINLGRYPKPEHEPLAFWGDGRKYDRIIDRALPCAELRSTALDRE